MTPKPRIRRVLEEIDGGRVLHVGCVGSEGDVGPCEMHQLLDTESDELVGVDIDIDGIEMMLELGHTAIRDDAQSLSNVQGEYDYVVATEVIEHLSNPGQMFEAVSDVLTDSGRLLITTPNPWAFVYLRRLAQGIDPVGNEDHTMWFDETTLRELYERYGYTGRIEHLEPSARGLTSLVRYLGYDTVGSTRLYAALEYTGDYQ